MILQSKIESAFSRIYSDKVLKTVEKYILYLASIGFIINLLIIFLKNYGFIDLSHIDSKLLQILSQLYILPFHLY